MKKHVKAKWLKALRTGVLSDGRKVKQGQHALKKNGNLCCLAVLAEEAVIEGVIPAPIRKSRNGNRGWYYGPADGDNNVLPETVQEWAGLSERDPLAGRMSLAQANDNYNKSFVEIADLIDKHL